MRDDSKAVQARAVYQAPRVRELEERLEFSTWSTSSSPYEQGEIEVQCAPGGIKIRWAGDKAWQEFPWHELALISGSLTETIKENIELEKQRAYNEGMQMLDEDMKRNVAERRAQIKILRPGPAGNLETQSSDEVHSCP